MRKYLISIVALSLAACEHPAAFRAASYAPDSSLRDPPLIRLTLNPGTDLAPVWTPAGDKILYTAERIDRDDNDLCFAVFPMPGATISNYLCRTTAPDDSVNAFRDAAISVDGRIAYVRASAHLLPVRPLPPDRQALVVAPLSRPNDVQVLRAIGYAAPSGRIHQGVSHVGWLGPSLLVYLGENVTYPRPCGGCPPDTVRTGLEIMTVDFSGPTPVLAGVSGTDSATSVAVGASGDTIYFTRAGQPQVFRYAFSSAQEDTIYDFGAGQQAQDVKVANGRLAAVVGDDLRFVTLATGGQTIIADVTGIYRYRRPAFSPDGSRVVFERAPRTRGPADIMMIDTP